MGRRVALGDSWAGGGERERISFALGRRENQGSLFQSGASLPTLADRSPARVGFNAPSSKNSRLIFAQQPRPNGKRNPLHHVLRTAGTTGRFIKGPCGKAGAEQGPGERGQSEEVRGQGKAPKGWQGGGVGAMGREGGGGGGGEQPHGRTRTGTDKHGRLERAECRGRRSGKTEQPEQPLRSASAATEQPNSR